MNSPLLTFVIYGFVSFALVYAMRRYGDAFLIWAASRRRALVGWLFWHVGQVGRRVRQRLARRARG
jgi:hypothetical protein